MQPRRARSTGSLHQPRAGHVAVRLRNGKVLVAGGFNSASGQTLRTAELYDPATGKWTVTGSMTDPREGATLTLLADGKAFVAGGVDADGNPGLVYRYSAEVYDPATGRWTLVPVPMVVDRAYHTATLLGNGKVLLAGGDGNGFDSAELYNPGSRTFTPTGSMHDERYRHSATLLPNGRVLVAGGGRIIDCCDNNKSVEVFNPATGTWTLLGDMKVARARHSATLLNNGKVLIAGGGEGSNSRAEVYNPATAASAYTERMVTSRTRHLAVKLGNGSVVVVGGVNSTGELRTVEAYNPATNAWTAKAPMLVRRAFHTLTQLQSGKLLVAAGSNAANGSLNSCELVQP